MEQTRQRLRRTVRDGRAGAFLESIGVEVGPTGATPSMAKAIEKALEVNKEVGVAVEGVVRESLAEDQGSVKQVEHISTREAEVAAG